MDQEDLDQIGEVIIFDENTEKELTRLKSFPHKIFFPVERYWNDEEGRMIHNSTDESDLIIYKSKGYKLTTVWIPLSCHEPNEWAKAVAKHLNGEVVGIICPE